MIIKHKSSTSFDKNGFSFRLRLNGAGAAKIWGITQLPEARLVIIR